LQWSKVKTILITALLIVNAFLLGSLLHWYYQQSRRASELMEHLRVLTAAQDIQLADEFQLPADKVLPLLSVDRSRTDEQLVASAMLGEGAVRSEREDGTVRVEGRKGYIVWNSDGTVQGEYALRDTPVAESELAKTAQQLFRDWGVWKDDACLDVVGRFATLTSTAAGLPVHNRSLTLFFSDDGKIMLTGFWSFGTPYAYARANGVVCAAADTLLAFASSGKPVGRIDCMQVGYRLQLDSSRRLQLVPTWKIETDKGEYLVDCAKKTTI